MRGTSNKTGVAYKRDVIPALLPAQPFTAEQPSAPTRTASKREICKWLKDAHGVTDVDGLTKTELLDVVAEYEGG